MSKFKVGDRVVGINTLTEATVREVKGDTVWVDYDHKPNDFPYFQPAGFFRKAQMSKFSFGDKVKVTVLGKSFIGRVNSGPDKQGHYVVFPIGRGNAVRGLEEHNLELVSGISREAAAEAIRQILKANLRKHAEELYTELEAARKPELSQTSKALIDEALRQVDWDKLRALKAELGKKTKEKPMKKLDLRREVELVGIKAEVLVAMWRNPDVKDIIHGIVTFGNDRRLFTATADGTDVEIDGRGPGRSIRLRNVPRKRKVKIWVYGKGDSLVATLHKHGSLGLLAETEVEVDDE